MAIVISPTQNIITSAVSQQTSLAGTNNAVSTTGNSVTNTPDVALTSTISDQVLGTSSLYNASVELAGLSSALQVAQTGTSQVSTLLQNLQGIAQQLADGSGNTSALQAEFQTLYSQINQIVAETSFGGTSLLDGSITTSTGGTGSTQDEEQGINIPNLSTQGLFGGNAPDVSTPENAASAVTSIGNAENTVNTASNTIETASNQINFAIASYETAQANSFASTSTLTESELGNTGFTSIAAKLLGEPDSSANTQTGKLSGSTLTLLNE